MTHSTLQIAQHVHGELIGPGDLAIDSLEQLDGARPGQLTFIGNAAYAAQWPDCAATAAVVSRGLDAQPGDGRALITVDDADLAMTQLLELFAPEPVTAEVGVHPSAVVDSSAALGRDVRIGPSCVVGPHVRIGDDAVLHANVTVMAHSVIGDGCVLWPGAVVRERCTLGRACILHANATIGSDGFGYRPAPDGRGPIKVPQIGTVEIGDEVEIGANAAVDRGKFAATVIGDGCKIDNLVQIAHNCRLGRCVIIAGNTGIAGSVTIEDGAILGGMVALKDHITIGAGARLTACAQVMTDVPAGEVWAGSPAREYHEAGREYAGIRRLPQIMKDLKHLKRKLDE